MIDALSFAKGTVRTRAAFIICAESMGKLASDNGLY